MPSNVSVLKSQVEALLKYCAVKSTQAEGFGYMHAILPVVAEFDAGVAQRVFNVFNLRRTPSEEEAEAVRSWDKHQFIDV